MNTPIRMPSILQEGQSNMAIQREAVSDGSNTFLAGALVVLSSGVLAAVATAGVVVYGQTPDKSHLATDQPPAALFGEMHYPFDLKDRILLINASAISSTLPVVGDSGVTWAGASLAVGQQYGILTAPSGTYAGYQFLNTSDTSTKLFTIVGLADGVSTTDTNPLLKVKIIDACILP